MKVTVDAGLCCASGMCVITASEVFDQNEEDGTVVLLDPVPSESLHAAVRDAESSCPSAAITVAE